MKSILSLAMVLFLMTSSAMAERKPLDKKHREIKPGASEVLVPNPKRQDGYDLVIKEHEVTYNDTTGLYTYRYWKTDSTYVDLLYEPFNRLDVTVACTVIYDGESDEYIYTYNLMNSKDSVQPLWLFILDIDRDLVTRTETPAPWLYHSTDEPPPGSPRWVFWGSMGGHISPGKSISLTIVSKHGPVIATCYSKGHARTFIHPEHPDLTIDELGVYPPDKEGLKGQTLAPGLLDADNAKAQVDAFLDIAEKWGWVSTDKKDTALVHISKGLDQKAFSLLKNELNPNQIGVEKEVAAFLEHLGKKQGFGDD